MIFGFILHITCIYESFATSLAPKELSIATSNKWDLGIVT
jgi:hypothetical protein